METTLPILPVQRFEFDRTRQAAPQVFEHMRDQIIALALPPGTVLSRIDLSTQYGISQTPVRDALMRLSEEGLVDIFPQHATLVSTINIARAQQAYFLRRSVELEVARFLAESAEPSLVEALRANVRRMRSMVDDGNYAEFTLLDQAFHRMLYDAANVPDLYTLVRRQSGHLDRLRRLHLPIAGKAREVVRDHLAIVEAIAAGNPARAENCVRAHLSGTLAHLDDIRARYAAYLS